jgi:hypothetical protein
VLLDAAVLGQEVPWRTVVALVCAIGATALPTAHVLLQRAGPTDRGGCKIVDGGDDNCAPVHSPLESAVGFSLSLVGGMGYACYLTACRSAALSCPHVPMNLAALLGTFIKPSHPSEAHCVAFTLPSTPRSDVRDTPQATSPPR